MPSPITTNAAGLEFRDLRTNDMREAELFVSARGSGLWHRQREHRAAARRSAVRSAVKRKPVVVARAAAILEDLHAPPDRHDQLRHGTPARAGHPIWFETQTITLGELIKILIASRAFSGACPCEQIRMIMIKLRGHRSASTLALRQNSGHSHPMQRHCWLPCSVA